MKFGIPVYPGSNCEKDVGWVIEKAAHSLGFTKVKDVKVGKYVTMTIEADSIDEVKQELAEMAKRFLVNPVIEEYTFEIEEVK